MNKPLGYESFKHGVFHEGNFQFYKYQDSSRIKLFNSELAFLNAETLLLSSVPCNGTKHKHIVGAQYRDGSYAFKLILNDRLHPYFKRIDLTNIECNIEITGRISETGSLIDLKDNGLSYNNYQTIARGIIYNLTNLPLLNPATADGKPISQGFSMSIKIFGGRYSFTYRFLSITNY